MNNSKIKIIATLGPSSDSKSEIKRLIQAGMNIARINFSHGAHETNEKIIKNIHKAEKELGTKIDLLIDLQGPKIRLGKLEKPIRLKRGQEIILSTKQEKIPIQYAKLPREVKPDSQILIDDGLIELKVISTNKEEIKCKVVQGGIISSNKGLNVPNGQISLKAITKKDIADLKFSLKFKPKYIALSFVRTAKDILELKQLIQKISNLQIVAKIETPQAIENLDEIAKVSDLLMVARGDLAVECGFEKVPVLQKKIIETAHKYGKEAIVATQMLASMQTNPIPTRAEVSDIALAIWEKADILMLSNETSVGKFPSKSIHVIKEVTKELS